MRVDGVVLLSVLLGGGVSALSAAEPTHARLRGVPFTSVKIQDRFWLPRLETNRTVTLPHNIKWCEDTGRISNFAKAAGREKGKFEGIYFNDSDVYKVLEGAAYSLAQHPDKQLEAKIDSIIEVIAAAQQPNGYLNTFFTIAEPDNRWTNLPVKHELYCAGHMFEAAVAYFHATGKRTFLDVACRFADHIDSIFGPGQRVGYSGHEEIELALVKLYQTTGNERYRILAEHFIAVRGQNRDPKEEYMQAHLPVKEQTDIVGHAVRAMYLYGGVADVAAMTGDPDYLAAMERLWRNVVLRKMFITGGIGTSAHNEGFTADYDLPNDSAYAETCASIGMVLWNHRLLLLHGQGRFGDVVERVLYNGLLSGVSLDGGKFFYVNPLGSRGDHHRQSWFGCACCPTNVVRFLPSLGGYVYATSTSGDSVWVNLYVASTAIVSLKDREIKLVQETDYPWSGQVKLKVDTPAPAEFEMRLRIPAWCEAFHIGVNGEQLRTEREDGYARIARKWSVGDVVELELSMPVQRIQANPAVHADLGRVALQRGPVLYCLEGADNGGKVRHLALPREAKLTEQFEPELLGGVVTLSGEALAAVPMDWTDRLYLPAAEPVRTPIKAVPYYAWDNREPGEMTLWLPEVVALAELPLAP